MRETVEFLSAHTLRKAEDATDCSFKIESQETDCAQSANSSVRELMRVVRYEGCLSVPGSISKAIQELMKKSDQ